MSNRYLKDTPKNKKLRKKAVELLKKEALFGGTLFQAAPKLISRVGGAASKLGTSLSKTKPAKWYSNLSPGKKQALNVGGFLGADMAAGYLNQADPGGINH